MGIVIVWLATFSTTSATSARKVLNALFFAKIFALVVIAVGGMYWMSVNGPGHLRHGFTGLLDSIYKLPLIYGP